MLAFFTVQRGDIEAKPVSMAVSFHSYIGVHFPAAPSQGAKQQAVGLTSCSQNCSFELQVALVQLGLAKP